MSPGKPPPDAAPTPRAAGPGKPANSDSPLTPDQLAELQRARVSARRVRRAAAIAAFSGWSMIIFAALTLALAVLDPLVGVAGAILLALGLNELRGGSRIRRFDPAGARILAINQVLLGALIVAYAAWRMHTGMAEAQELIDQARTGDPAIDGMITDLTEGLTVLVYGTVAAAGVVVPGLTALYYGTRARVVRSYLRRTPAWVVATLRAAG